MSEVFLLSYVVNYLVCYHLILFSRIDSTAGVLGYIYNAQISSAFTESATAIQTGANTIVTDARGLNDVIELEYDYLPESAASDLSVCDKPLINCLVEWLIIDLW